MAPQPDQITPWSWRLPDNSGKAEMLFLGHLADNREELVGTLTLTQRNDDGATIWETGLQLLHWNRDELRHLKEGLWRWRQTYEQGFALNLSRADYYHPSLRLALAPSFSRPRGKATFTLDWGSWGCERANFHMSIDQSGVLTAISEIDAILRDWDTALAIAPT